MLSAKHQLLTALAAELDKLQPGAGARAAFESPKVAAHGDLACTAAMQLAKALKQNPRQLGEALREALLAYGPNLEWNLNSARQQATFSNGFELADGQLSAQADGLWQVSFYGENHEVLKPEGELLIQQASATWPEQRFARPKVKVDAAAPAGSSFEYSLYEAFLAGSWKIRSGPGEGGTVQFQATPDMLFYGSIGKGVKPAGISTVGQFTRVEDNRFDGNLYSGIAIERPTNVVSLDQFKRRARR